MRPGLRSGNTLEQAAADFANGSPKSVSSVKPPPSVFVVLLLVFFICFLLRQNTPPDGGYFLSIDPSDVFHQNSDNETDHVNVERSPENVSLINPFLFRDGCSHTCLFVWFRCERAHNLTAMSLLTGIQLCVCLRRGKITG